MPNHKQLEGIFTFFTKFLLYFLYNLYIFYQKYVGMKVDMHISRFVVFKATYARPSHYLFEKFFVYKLFHYFLKGSINARVSYFIEYKTFIC